MPYSTRSHVLRQVKRPHLLAHDLGVEQGLGFDSHLLGDSLSGPRPETKRIEHGTSPLLKGQSSSKALPKRFQGYCTALYQLLHSYCTALHRLFTNY